MKVICLMALEQSSSLFIIENIRMYSSLACTMTFGRSSLGCMKMGITISLQRIERDPSCPIEAENLKKSKIEAADIRQSALYLRIVQCNFTVNTPATQKSIQMYSFGARRCSRSSVMHRATFYIRGM